MALWFPSGNGSASTLANIGFDSTSLVYLTAWIYTGPSQSARIFSIWPSAEGGSLLLQRTASELIGYGHAEASTVALFYHGGD